MVTEQIRTTLAELTDSDAEFSVERPKQPDHGDYASNVALVVAKKQGVNPRSLAEQLAEKLNADQRFESVEVAGPGFLNFRLAPSVWQEAVEEILKAKGKYGTFPKTGRKILVEFISANPTGPLTLGNGRGGFGGDVLSRVLARAGHDVTREYYINDAGNQIATLGATIKGEAGDDGYKGEYVEELKERVKADGSAAEVGQAAASEMLKEIQQTVKKMGITFDAWFSEREELHESGEIARTLEDLKKIDATYEKEGALWLKTTHMDDDKDRVLKKSDGELTYMAADLAHYYGQFVERKIDESIMIVGADHHGYIERMQAGVKFLRKAEHFDGQLKIIISQLVRLMQDGQEVKMSKRAGTFVTLDELLEEVEPDVARFFFVMKSFDTHMDFDLDLAKEHSQKNPVYYLKYAYARIAGILKKAGRKSGGDLSKLGDPAELALIAELCEFPQVITRTAEDYQVQRVAHYALALADAFHKFYERCPVISEDKELTAARLRLVEATKQVLASVGETIGIEMPERM
jgi:arginyl-tRNA synthetase